MYFDTETERFEADIPVYGITRISPNSVHVLLEPSSQKSDSDARSAIRLGEHKPDRRRQHSHTDIAATQTLQDLDVTGTVWLECALNAASHRSGMHSLRERSPPRHRR